mgnify:CR=1 FL=1
MSVDSAPWLARKVKEREQTLKKLIDAVPDELATTSDEYRRACTRFYAALHETWERAVEEIVLNDVVRRFGSNVGTLRLGGVERIQRGGQREIEGAVCEGPEDCACGFFCKAGTCSFYTGLNRGCLCGGVAITAPGYPAYRNILKALGLAVVEIPLDPDGYLKADQVEAAHRQGPLAGVLFASPANPTGVGAIARLKFSNGKLGPARLITAGSGYWSQDSAVQVLATPDHPIHLEVKWPNGKTTTPPIPDGAKEISVGSDGKIIPAK